MILITYTYNIHGVYNQFITRGAPHCTLWLIWKLIPVPWMIIMGIQPTHPKAGWASLVRRSGSAPPAHLCCWPRAWQIRSDWLLSDPKTRTSDENWVFKIQENWTLLNHWKKQRHDPGHLHTKANSQILLPKIFGPMEINRPSQSIQGGTPW